ncbi:hypothetical protein FRC10_000744 [Ceratobasidium sp. 414]|nr:hypothetical protein FRC10_000744 [Ceratobasidium sp. 414]
MLDALPELKNFLDYVNKEHGIEYTGYLNTLVHDWMGPDVLGEMEVSELMGYGMPQGDAHHLKHAALSWESGEKLPTKKAWFGQGAQTN